MNRLRGLVSRVAGGVSISGEAQRVFAEYGGKIAGMLARLGGCSVGIAICNSRASAASTRPKPLRNRSTRLRCEPEMISLPKRRMALGRAESLSWCS